ncbi:D-isomer specific 2-hydroxyacid dehydrogenase family protein [uncultured Draconibacterium sp.]|uniref:D-isomer specific 2-hydroxyacid dehydrogenase family protein n=1 Tax=uncultured Draconibacterium sp. TaxID=1573823 RepID=UPI002604A21B|nr:D-isomer specific 2-hydroxyacid dehydrogenase family protein [uncultured Draconibacterium sp.]
MKTEGLPNVQITAYEVRDDEKKLIEKFEKELAIKIVSTKRALSEGTLHLAEGSNAITTLGQSQLNASMLEKLQVIKIKCISTRTIGYNHIDVKAAEKLGIKVCNATYDPNGVADYSVMLILMLLRRYKQAMFRANVNDYSLEGLQGREMKDLTIGVVGTGNIGSHVIENLSGFGCRILAYNKSINPKAAEKATYVSLDELYEQSDIISFHLPLTDSTYKMVNRSTLAQMKNGVMLINTARGELMDFEDIIEGIENHKIGALGLDVFENEHGIYHHDRRNDIISNKDMAYIRQFPNVIMTQHIAFYTDTAVESMVSSALNGIIEVLTTGSSKHEV